MLCIGQTIDRYVIEGRLGAGGAGVVLLGRHKRLASTHALKLVVARSQAERERVLREGRFQARIRHPNIVAVTDLFNVDLHDGKLRACLVSDHAKGGSLTRWLARFRGRFDTRVKVLHDVASGLRASHAAGMVHRDLKPSNLVVDLSTGSPVVQITDFGVARALRGPASATLTQDDMVLGTPAYIAPESLVGDGELQPTADIFAFGCIAHELLLGSPAFPSRPLVDRVQATRRGITLRGTQAAESLEPWMVDLLEGCLAPEPADRITDGKALLRCFPGEDQEDEEELEEDLDTTVVVELTESGLAALDIEAGEPPQHRIVG